MQCEILYYWTRSSSMSTLFKNYVSLLRRSLYTCQSLIFECEIFDLFNAIFIGSSFGFTIATFTIFNKLSTFFEQHIRNRKHSLSTVHRLNSILLMKEICDGISLLNFFTRFKNRKLHGFLSKKTQSQVPRHL